MAAVAGSLPQELDVWRHDSFKQDFLLKTLTEHEEYEHNSALWRKKIDF